MKHKKTKNVRSVCTILEAQNLIPHNFQCYFLLEKSTSIVDSLDIHVSDDDSLDQQL